MTSSFADPLQGPDPNESMGSLTTQDGRTTTKFWGEGGRPALLKRVAVPAYQVTDTVFDADAHDKAQQIIARYPHERSAIMPLLHLVQSIEGFTSKNGIAWIAGLVGVEESEVNGVATFYDQYRRTPAGEHVVSVCTNTLCAALGGDQIYAAIKEALDVDEDGGTAGVPGEKGSITIQPVQCLASCDHGPVITVNMELYDNQTPQSAVELVEALRRGERPAPTRGAPLRDFKAAALELAGFFDGDDAAWEAALDGPSQSPESLRGSQLAADRGWVAPAMPETPPALPDLPEKK